MGLYSIRTYSRKVEELFIAEELNGRTWEELSYDHQLTLRSLKALTEFTEKGYITVSPKIVKPKSTVSLDGPIGAILLSFLEHRRTETRLKPATIEKHRNYLASFLDYCNRKHLTTITDIDFAFILHFLSERQSIGGRQKGGIISTLRFFFKYAFEQQLLAIDYSGNMPLYKSVSQPQLPSTYTENEIVQLLCSISRSSAVGKRNYAIILMAVRLGFRASDIARLKFENLHWSTSTIVIKQYKTGQDLVVPLLPDIGNAIIDYLKYGRVESVEPYVFLKERPPYSPMLNGSIVSDTVIAAFAKSGIDIKNRKSGSHSLRHSLVSRMLEESTVLPVITEVLGHTSSESTRYYLRIDFTSMKQCTLDVPPVPIDFYQRKGGVFYGSAF
jgi:site-specific recombinase XerD